MKNAHPEDRHPPMPLLGGPRGLRDRVADFKPPPAGAAVCPKCRGLRDERIGRGWADCAYCGGKGHVTLADAQAYPAPRQAIKERRA